MTQKMVNFWGSRAVGRAMPVFRATVLLLIVTSLVPYPALGADQFAGKVVGIADGDTITVLRGKDEIKVRLHGVDCPERAQDFGKRAKQFTSDAAFGKIVTVIIKDIDRYGRTVGVVMLPGDRSLNHALVEAGLAWWYRKYAPDDQTLRQLQDEAKTSQRGLWSHPNPVPPWEYRRHKRSGTTGEKQPPSRTGKSACCKICRSGKACGDSCISRERTCGTPSGCACDGGATDGQ